jgi:hypothetical protein
MPDKRYEVGEKAWIVPGFRGSALIAVQVTITEIDDHWEKKDPDGGILFYWLDEPIGASLSADDLMDEKAAKMELLARYKDWVEYRKDGEEAGPGALQKWRQEKMGFISGTWPAGEHPGFREYEDKKPGAEWFNVDMLRGIMI